MKIFMESSNTHHKEYHSGKDQVSVKDVNISESHWTEFTES